MFRANGHGSTRPKSPSTATTTTTTSSSSSSTSPTSTPRVFTTSPPPVAYHATSSTKRSTSAATVSSSKHSSSSVNNSQNNSFVEPNGHHDQDDDNNSSTLIDPAKSTPFTRVYTHFNLKKPAVNLSPRVPGGEGIVALDSPKRGNTFGMTMQMEPSTVTALEYDTTGRFLAIGDAHGRVTVLSTVEWEDEFEFKSHTMQFDSLKSQQIEEKINVVKWLRPVSPASSSVLVTNDKVIKLWRLHNSGEAVLRRSFSNHSCAINSLAISCDGEYFASADDLCVELWHLDHSERSMTVQNIKPDDMDELNEIITGINFHPQFPNLLVSCSSGGCAHLIDVRDPTRIRQKRYVQSFITPKDNNDPLGDVLASISDCSFDVSGTHLHTRDYMTIQTWDFRNPTAPASVTNVNELVRPYLADLYENDVIFDKFWCRASPKSQEVITGTYGTQFAVCNTATQSSVLVSPNDDNTLDFAKKVTALSWHPGGEQCAVVHDNLATVMNRSGASVSPLVSMARCTSPSPSARRKRTEPAEFDEGEEEE
eukprot:PhM_4_TR2808/c0_g1_i1/m.29780/K04354/PPP2R2; serine/threonine-protein phosphatase 2A regulatory subunit B